MNLPVIESCDGCGACCFEQGSPPGYLLILCQPETIEPDGPFADDLQRFKDLPANAIRDLLEYRERLLRGEVSGDGICIWFNVETRRCSHYEHRPSICREEVVPGDEGCLTWREEYAAYISEGGH